MICHNFENGDNVYGYETNFYPHQDENRRGGDSRPDVDENYK